MNNNNIQELARAKSAADKAYESAMRQQLQVYKPLAVKKFWTYLDILAEKIKRAKTNGFGASAVKSGVHNLFCEQVYGSIDQLGAWEDMARFQVMYEDLKGMLSKKLWELPGIEKGDDSYGDFIDSLPLAGQEIYEGLMQDDIANWKQLEAAMADHPLKDFILEGENYVEMRFEEVLTEAFIHVSRDTDTEYEEEVVRPHAVMVTEPVKKFSFDGNLKLETSIYGPFDSEEDSLAWLKQEGHAGVPLRLFPGKILQ